MSLYNEINSLFERKHSPIENKIKAMENLLGYSISSELRECLNKEIEKLKIRLDITQDIQIDVLNKILEHENEIRY